MGFAIQYDEVILVRETESSGSLVKRSNARNGCNSGRATPRLEYRFGEGVISLMHHAETRLQDQQTRSY